MILSISPWMRFTSESPSWWICAALISVVVSRRTRSAYQAAPPGSAPRPTESRARGRYSRVKKSWNFAYAGTMRSR